MGLQEILLDHKSRAKGLCRIVVGGSAEGNEIIDVFRRSPLRVIFPRIGGAPVKETVLINTAGGIAGGDRLDCEVTASANTSIAVTSQTAERATRVRQTRPHFDEVESERRCEAGMVSTRNDHLQLGVASPQDKGRDFSWSRVACARVAYVWSCRTRRADIRRRVKGSLGV